MNAKISDAPEFHAAPGSAVILTSYPQFDGPHRPVMHIGHQSFAFGHNCETEAESDWWCDQLRHALERAGCRVIQSSVKPSDAPRSE